MDDTLGYLAINRQRGLRAELSVIANNVANIDTPGFRREGLVFSEVVRATGSGESISMANAGARFAQPGPGELTMTGGALDIAIEGEGFFALAAEEGVRLTRGGAFQRGPDGALVTAAGLGVLDDGLAPIQLPPGVGRVVIAADGTISADGAPLGRIGVFTAPGETLERVGGTAFATDAAVEPLPDARVVQGALEGSNVGAVEEIARMIEVSRAYERIQSMLSDDHDRVRETLRTLGETV